MTYVAWPKIEVKWPVVQVNTIERKDLLKRVPMEIRLRAACLKDGQTYQMVHMISPEMARNCDIDIIKKELKEHFIQFVMKQSLEIIN